MLSELCAELKNWFDRNQPKLHGAFEISNGKIAEDEFLEVIQNNQYFRIIGSVFNDGVYKFTDDLQLTDEVFVGSVWLMAIPKEVIDLSEEINDWITKYNETVNSPFSSESFGGYSYTKKDSDSDSSAGSLSWQNAFASKLNLWRKI